MRGGPTPSWTYEEAALQRGFRNIGGVDEAGRGPLAGPVVAACVVLPAGTERPLVRDSKSLSPAARDRAYASIVDAGAAVGVGQASATEIDDANILRATHTAMLRAIEACPVRPDYVLVDGLPVPLLTIPNRAVVKGDVLCVSIASASIVAKVTRDRMMSELDRTFPGYGFATHKGYPTPEHMAALEAMGPCPAH
ncbi:MAG: ribonuclease HII, partial [Armatimonadetes bacterium]|nr:ribonuclease HII [Armatimonadota bacterium]